MRGLNGYAGADSPLDRGVNTEDLTASCAFRERTHGETGLSRRHDDNAGFRAVEDLTVCFRIMADLRTRFDDIITADDRPAQAGAAFDMHVILNDAILQLHVLFQAAPAIDTQKRLNRCE